MCPANEDEPAPRAHPSGRGHLATIAALLNVPVESLQRDADAPSASPATPGDDCGELMGIYLGLEPAPRRSLLDAARRFARGEPAD